MSDELQQGMDREDPKGGYARDKDMGAPGEGRFKGRKRRKVSYLTINKIETVDYKDIAILRRFLNDRGKILPSRQTGNTAKQQRMITRAIHRARELALIPFTVQEMGSDRKEYMPRRERGERGDRGERTARAPREDRAEVAETTSAAVETVEAPEAETSAEATPE